MKIVDLPADELQVVNIGLESFAQDLRDQGVAWCNWTGARRRRQARMAALLASLEDDDDDDEAS